MSRARSIQRQVAGPHARQSGRNGPVAGVARPVEGLVYLQRSLGNRAVMHLLQHRQRGIPLTADAGSDHFGLVPASTSRDSSVESIVGTRPVERGDDPHEHEADRVAEHVMRGTTASGSPRAADADDREGRPVPSRGPASAKRVSTSATRGDSLPPAEQRYFEARFGRDFSDVRVHHDDRAASRVKALSARAFTIGANIHFGRAEYVPGTDAGRHLIAHELAHVLQQQQSGPAVQRQPLLGQQSPAVPTELRSSADLGRMSDAELTDRHDWILDVLGQFTMSTPDTVLLESEAARIGVELARREALAAGRTFGEDSIERMKEYFIQNSKKPKKPKKPKDNPPPAPPGGWRDSCIVALNNGMKIVTSKPALPTTPETIEQTMDKIAASGHSGVAREIWFEGKGGKITRGGARPEKLQASIWDTVMSLAGGDPGWSVFTMSMDDGNHSVTLTLDANNPSVPRMYWSDQWPEKGGSKEYTRSELDAEVTSLVQGWWDKQKEGRKYKPVVRVWRVRATAAASSGP